jgi:S-adenosyl methyltransferase
MEKPAAVPVVDMSRPHMARIYDYFLGGQNHFAPDRETAEKCYGGVARKP